jgi:inner membrane transporter RhtA
VWRRPWRIAGRLDRDGRRLLVAWGAVLAAMNACFYLAIDRLPLGTVATIEFLPVVALAALGARTRRNAAALALAAAGVPLLTGVHLGAEPFALALAGANAVLFAAYIVLADRVAKHGDGLAGIDGLAASMLIAAVVVTPATIGQAVPALTDPTALLAGIGVGLCSSVIPYVSDQLALRRLPRATYALMVSLLPATATVIGVVVLTQVPEPAEILGIALVIAGVALHRPAPPPDQRKGMRMTRSSSSEGSPRPSRLDVVSQSASSGPTATVRMRPKSPSNSDSGSPSRSPSTGIFQSRVPRSAPTQRWPRA